MDSPTTVNITLAELPVAQLDALHDASLRILADTGVNVHSAELRRLLQVADADVRDDLRVRLPASLVERAIAGAPGRIDVFDREGKPALRLEGRRSYFGTGSDLRYTLDAGTGQRRESTLDDVARSARLCEHLEHIDFVMSYGLPTDVPAARCELEQFRVMRQHTRKPPIMTLCAGIAAFEKLHQCACDTCGGEAAFREKPNYIMYGQFVSPLQHDPGALARLLFCADHGIPLIYVPTINMGASGPVTLAGALALANAECLAGLVMHQARAPGAPFIYGGCVSPLDMRTTVYAYGAPEWRLADVVLSQLSQRYELPMFGTAGASDTKGIDAQTGAEWGYSLLLDLLAGVNLIHDVGYLESGLTGSLEALVIADETVGMVKRIAAGFELSTETLALDMIDRVGPAGHYLEEDHTLTRYRQDVWYPGLFERSRFHDWQAAGSKDVVERAAERVRELLG